MVMEVVHEDMGEEDSMQCMMNHPQKNTTPGGICALCLQEKLGKLVSSSFPPPLFPSSSSSPSPSFRSDAAAGGGGGSSLQLALASSANPNQIWESEVVRKSKLPFVLKHKKLDKDDAAPDPPAGAIVFKRSKSIATPRRRGMLSSHNSNKNGFLDDENVSRRRFWSFLYLSSKHYSSAKKSSRKDVNFVAPRENVGSVKSRESSKREEGFVVVEENGDNVESPAAFERKVSRSKSVGCGSRSFSGDFFERISFSTGFGDCALRRVESQREGRKAKLQQQQQRSNGQQDCGIIKERVRCGGIFSGLMIASSSSSSSSCSSYRVSEDSNGNVNGNGKANSGNHQLSHVRSRSWGWLLASPMRVFSKPSSAKKKDATGKNVTPNLTAIPSLLSVSG